VLLRHGDYPQQYVTEPKYINLHYVLLVDAEAKLKQAEVI
jgi:hypothetical protein